MRHLSHTPQPAVVRSTTTRTNRIAVSGSAARRHRRSVRSLGSVLIALLLLLPGTIWAEGLALDLPTAPVHVAAASDGSAVASVNLSDPTKFPFSSTGKWKGYLEFLGKPGTERSLGQPDLFLPLLQDANDMTFFNLRGQLQFDNTDVHEYNIGLGHRHMFQEWILGGYGYYDQRHTQFGSAYSQFTGGLEAMSVDWGARLNGYLPENKTETIMSGANASVIRPGDQIKVQIDGIVQEKALPGVDGEVGYLLPIPWKAYTAVFDETRVYAGGYHFFGEDNFESVTGPRGRVEWRAYDLPVLGPGSRFMMGVEAQWDEPRGSQAFGLASLRIPFDVFSDKSTRKALTGLDRRMLQPVIRDVDVVTSEVDVPAEITAALTPAGHAYTKAFDIEIAGKTAAEVQDEMDAHAEEFPDETIAHILLGNPDDMEEIGGEQRDVLDVSGDSLTDPTNPIDPTVLADLIVRDGHTLASAGRNWDIGYQSRSLGSGTVTYRPAGTPVGLTRSDCPAISDSNGVSEKQNINAVLGMEANTYVTGMAVNAGGCGYGIRLQTSGTRYLHWSTFREGRRAGVSVEGLGATLDISRSQFIDTGADFGYYNATQAERADGLVTTGKNPTGKSGITDRVGALAAVDGGFIKADHLSIRGGGGMGVTANGADPVHDEPSVIDIRDSVIDGSPTDPDNLPTGYTTSVHGLSAGWGGQIYADGMTIANMGGDGADAHNTGDTLTQENYTGPDAFIDIRNSVLRNNSIGLLANRGAKVYAERVKIFDNDVGLIATLGGKVYAEYVTLTHNGTGAIARNGGVLSIEDSIITENARDGVGTNIGSNGLVGHVTIKRSSITNNGRYGVASLYGSTVLIEDSRITGNGYYGLLAESWAGDVLPVDGSTTDTTGLSGPEGFQEPRSILKATNVIVSGNGRDKEGGGYGVLNRGGEITLIGSQVFDNTGGNYRNEAGFFRQDAPEFMDSIGERNWDYDACFRHDGTITVDGQSLGTPIVLPSPVENDPDRTCTVWPSP